MRYAIRKVWNTEQDTAAVDSLKPDGYTIRRRARGHRFGQRRYWQSFPLDKAAYYTAYFAPKDYDAWAEYQPLQVLDYKGIDCSGKIRLRLVW